MAGSPKTEADYQCPNCGPVSARTCDSRPAIFSGGDSRFQARKRFKECPNCGHRGQTFEVPKEWLFEVVQGKDRAALIRVAKCLLEEAG